MRRLHYCEISNYKGARYVAFPVEPGVTQLVGPNGAGKSSALDAIMACLAGARHVDPKPLTSGEVRGYVKLDLGDVTVERKISESNAERGGVLTVRAKDGRKWGQSELDVLFGDFSFDPLAVARQKPAELIVTLQRLAGDEFVAELARLDDAIKTTAEERTMANRALKRFGSQPDPGPEPDVPDTTNILAQMSAAEQWNEDQRIRQATIERMESQVRHDQQYVAKCQETVAALTRELAEAEGELTDARHALVESSDMLKNMQAPEPLKDTSDLKNQIIAAGSAQKALEEWNRKADRWREWSATTEACNDAERRLKDLRDARLKHTRTAKLPIDGLTWSDDGVLYNGIPMEQVSTSERLRICVKLAMALSPDLRLMLIREGSLLDEESFTEIAELAAAEGYEVLMEVVGRPHDGQGVVIEIREGRGEVNAFDRGRPF